MFQAPQRTPRNIILTVKVTVAELLKKLLALCQTRCFVTVLINTRSVLNKEKLPCLWKDCIIGHRPIYKKTILTVEELHFNRLNSAL